MKIIYKIVNTIAILALVPVLLFLPMFKFIMVVGVSSESQVVSILGSMFDITQVISNIIGIDIKNLPEKYTLPDLYDIFFGKNAMVSSADLDMTAIPDTVTKFLTAAAILFAITIFFALIALILGLFTKKKGITASFAAGGIITAYASSKCFSHIAGQFISGKISMSTILGSIKSLAEYQSYLKYINIDIRTLRLDSAYTMMILILAVVVLLNVSFLIIEKTSDPEKS